MISVLVLFLLAFIASVVLYTFLGGATFVRVLVNDTRGIAGNMVNNFLSDRGDGGVCSMVRIPTGTFPFYSTTLRGTLDANGNATVSFKAERDMLFIGLSADADDAAPASATISAEYCNTKILVRSAIEQWKACCERKPIFLQGVADNKTLEFTINGGTPAGDYKITLHGLQGKGCCG